MSKAKLTPKSRAQASLHKASRKTRSKKFSNSGVSNGLIFAIVCFIAVLTIVTFWQVTDCKFLTFDDDVYVTKNPHVQEGLTQKSIKWAFSTLYAGFWHPLTWLSFMLDYQLYGLDSGGFHVTNLLLHVASAVLLFLAFTQMTHSVWPSAFVACLFAVHPLSVESVAWVAERKNVLCIFFWMFTLWTYARYVQRPGVQRYLAVLFTFTLGLMAKSMIITLPFLLLILDYWPLGRLSFSKSVKIEKYKKNRRQESLVKLVSEKFVLIIIAAVFVILTLLAEHKWGVVKSFDMYPLRIRIGNAMVSYVNYIGKIFWPVNLSVFYPHPENALNYRLVFAAIGVLIGITVLIFSTGRSRRWLIVGWLWFFVTLLPVIGLIQIGLHAMADRYAYGTIIGIFIIVAWQSPKLFSRFRNIKPAIAIAGCLVIFVLAGLTRVQVGYWKDSITLFSHAAKVTSNNYWAHNNIGVTLVEHGQIYQAIGHYKKALEIEPNNSMILNNMGTALANAGQVGEAILRYKQAIRSQPLDWNSRNNLGVAFLNQNQIEQAIVNFRQAVKLKPGYVEAHNNWGIALASNGRIDEAIIQFKKVVQLDPDYAHAYNNLGNAFLDKQEFDKAMKYFTEALRLNTMEADTHYNIGVLLSRKGDIEQAIVCYKKVLQINPAHSAARERLMDMLRLSKTK